MGVLEVRANDRLLTEGMAHGANDLFAGPIVSGYHIAEWLLWNMWRLRWEAQPENPASGWAFSHRLSSIGEGYVWPNIEISSDGVRAIISSSPTIDPATSLYRFVSAPAFEVVIATELEESIRSFANAVLGLLGNADVVDTNLHRLWRDVERERQDPDAARLRRFEARLGCDPDEIAAAKVRAAAAAACDLGAESVEELAADAGCRGVPTVPSVRELNATAKRAGWDLRVRDAVQLRAADGGRAWGTVAAWRVGVAAARALRRQEGLDGQPIGNQRLAELAGTQADALAKANAPSALSFVLETGSGAQVALRSKWVAGKRFDLARLLGDRLLDHHEPLLPATRAYTYRQKAQRAFAAELLCPYEAVCDFLGDDRSEERYEDAADHFEVSPLAVSTVLLDNERHLHGPSVIW